jgi:protoporphyrinogen oxidase
MEIAIIGGGLTGLTSAYRFLKSGHKVTIFEKGNELGGLATSFKLGDANLEIFYHHVFKTDYDFLNLVEEMGLSEKMMWLDSSVSIYRDGEVFPFVGPIDLIKFKPLPFIDRIRAGLVTLFLQKYKNWENLKNISAYDWMMKYAGRNVTEVVWEPLLKGKFNDSYKDISMAWLWARIHIRANSRKGLLEKEMLGYMDGGFKILFDKLVSEIKKLGGQIVTKATVSNIKSLEGSQIQIDVNGKNLKFDKVLITIPSPLIKGLIHKEVLKRKDVSDYIASISSIKYLAAKCLVFTSTQNLADYYWHNVNDTKFPFLVFIHHTKLLDKERYGNKYVYYLAKYLPIEDPIYTMDQKNLEKLWFKYLRQMYPQFEEKYVKDKFVFSSKYAQHIVDMKYFATVPKKVTPLENVYISNFSLIYPEDRGMNYAVRDGDQIAKIML